MSKRIMSKKSRQVLDGVRTAWLAGIDRDAVALGADNQPISGNVKETFRKLVILTYAAMDRDLRLSGTTPGYHPMDSHQKPLRYKL